MSQTNPYAAPDGNVHQFLPVMKTKTAADQRLTAAAPDLLATLKAIVARCDGRFFDTDQVTGETFYYLATSAIAKAEGRRR
jgi:hypothetical protein